MQAESSAVQGFHPTELEFQQVSALISQLSLDRIRRKLQTCLEHHMYKCTYNATSPFCLGQGYVHLYESAVALLVLLVSTVKARYKALQLRARLSEGRACKALQANCEALQGSAWGNYQGTRRYQTLRIIYISSIMLRALGVDRHNEIR
jgi:hypothetical protein